MLEKDINSTHVFYMSNISNKDLKEIEKAMTEKYGNNNEICYNIKRGYCETGEIQIEAMYFDNKIFAEAVNVVIGIVMNSKPLWNYGENDF